MSDDEKRAAETGAEADAEEPDIADEEELDVEIQRVSPKKSRGCGATGWIILIIILALVAIVGGVRYREHLEEEAQKARDTREASYRAQEGTINQNIQTAAQTAAGGEVEQALRQLVNAEEKWGQMAAGANSAGDTTFAEYAAKRKASLNQLLQELDADRSKAAELAKEAAALDKQVTALEKQQDEINSKVRDRILQLAGTAAEVEAEPETPAGE